MTLLRFCQDQFAPLFKAKLWKVKAEGHFSGKFFFGGKRNFLKKWGSRVSRSPYRPMLQTCHRHDLCDVCIMTPGAFYPILRWPKEAGWLVWARDVDCQERLLGKQSCCGFPFCCSRSEALRLAKADVGSGGQNLGSLVYWSKKEDRNLAALSLPWLATMVKLHNHWCRWDHKPWLVNLGELVYYTADDISNAKFVFLEKDDAYHPFLGGLGGRASWAMCGTQKSYILSPRQKNITTSTPLMGCSLSTQNHATNHPFRTFRCLPLLREFPVASIVRGNFTIFFQGLGKCLENQQLSISRFAFQVHLAPSSGVEFAPGEFAAESEAMRDRPLVWKETGFFDEWERDGKDIKLI